MTDQTKDRVRAAADALIRKASDDGRLIEVGWLTLRLLFLDPETPPDQVAEMRMAFFAGAQHLFASMMGSAFDDGAEETEGDEKRLGLIADELDAFAVQLKHRMKGGRA